MTSRFVKAYLRRFLDISFVIQGNVGNGTLERESMEEILDLCEVQEKLQCQYRVRGRNGESTFRSILSGEFGE